MNPLSALDVGYEILTAFMERYGYSFELGECSRGTDTGYASGAYVRGGRRLEIYLRPKSGRVTYRIGQNWLDHGAYMHWLGVGAERQFLGFADNPGQAFTHLCYDLGRFCGDFLTGSGEDFCKFAQLQLKVRRDLVAH